MQVLHLNTLYENISPWAGIDIKGLEGNLCTALKRIKRLALKSKGKLDLHVVPHYLYQLVLATLPVITLRQLDQKLQIVIKDIYHLPQSVANRLIYSDKRVGGLGFSKLW